MQKLCTITWELDKKLTNDINNNKLSKDVIENLYNFKENNSTFQLCKLEKLKFVIKFPKQIIRKLKFENNGSSDIEIKTFNIINDKTVDKYKIADSKILLVKRFDYYDEKYTFENVSKETFILNNQNNIKNKVFPYEYAQITLNSSNDEETFEPI